MKYRKKPATDARVEPASVTTSRHLRAIADHWPMLLLRLGKEGAPDDGGDITRGTPGASLPIDAHISDVKAETETWLLTMTTRLRRDTNWRPPDDLSTPGLLRNIADWRVGHFTDHEDRAYAEGFVEEAERMERLVRRTAYPSGVRKIPLHVHCIEDQCSGEYQTLLIPNREIQDMVCSRDPAHRMSPWEWARGRRRGLVVQEAIA